MYKKSSFCAGNGCVEVEVITPSKANEGVVAVRSSDDKSHCVVFDYAEWNDFIKGAKAGEFDIKETQ